MPTTRDEVLLGVDTGGTFTDFVAFEDGRLRVHKVLSTPAAPERAILRGIEEMALDPARLRVIHGSTVATNAVLEGKGAATAFVTNRGFADLLTIGRQARPELYRFCAAPRRPPVPPSLCLETGGRLAADGRELEPLTEADLRALRRAVEEAGVEAVAISLLFAQLDERSERAIARAMPDGVFVSRSSAVLPEQGEYERGIATWLNATVGPRMQGYLDRLRGALAPAPVAVMQSAGRTVAAEQAAEHGVQLLLSGPAGGLMAARWLGETTGHRRLMSFDIGGTSTDVALIDGEVGLTNEGAIAGYPVAVPQVDMHTIGAGGGSIARVDAGGLLQVGPESAGADPGPACYGSGGSAPTLTDANVVLGRLYPDASLGGSLTLDVAAAEAAVAGVGSALGMGPVDCARGIVRLAVERMARALRVISVERGHDPADFVLTAFGGAGGLHVCELAEAMGMQRAMVPRNAGVLSAQGMLVAPPGRQRSLGLRGRLERVGESRIAAELERLRAGAAAELAAEGVGLPRARFSLDLRYEGQAFALGVPWTGDCAAAEAAFHARHEARFGHAMDAPVELVAVRAGLEGAPRPVRMPEWPAGVAARPIQVASLPGFDAPVPVFDREALASGQRVAGPAIIAEPVSTTWVAPGWTLEVDRFGNLLLDR